VQVADWSTTAAIGTTEALSGSFVAAIAGKEAATAAVMVTQVLEQNQQNKL